MCYYNGIAVTSAEKQALKARVRFVPEYDFWDQPLIIGPYYPKMPMLKLIPGKRDLEVVLAEWGFLPPVTKTEDHITDFRTRFMTLNAKVENLFISEEGKESMYAEAAMGRHCLIPSTHFFEYRHLYKRGVSGKILKATEAYPYLICMKDHSPYYFAGIWNENNLHGTTITILTTVANQIAGQVHNLKKRMPVIMTKELAREWIYTPNLTRSDVQTIGGHQFDSSKMKAYTVGKPLLTNPAPMVEVIYKEVPALGEEDILITPQSSIF